ncbi:MAG: hypothetical protein HC767_06440 [Akkermansiaceae bacterium]|nr:hypothetical protein [Akkermansiaceae bacterium]
MFRIEDPKSVAEHAMSNPLMQEVQKKLSKERCEELVATMERVMGASKLEDGSCGKAMSAVAAMAYKP